MFSPLRSLLVALSCLLTIASLTTLSVAQLCPTGTPCVTTWHNDLGRTGWQQNEATLTADPNQPGAVNQTTFGLLYQWAVQGRVYAQPLAVSNVPVTGCTTNCPNVVFVATEQDMLYAFNATSSSGATIWPPLNLATIPDPHGTFIDCTTNTTWSVCTGKTEEGLPTPFSTTDVGVTGTPVIDPSTNTLYVVAAVEISNVINYYLFAVDITAGSVKKYTKILGSVPGSQTPPTPKCTTGGSGTIQSFNINHIQRSGLLLLNGVVYVSFAPLPEPSESGWMFGYFLAGSIGSYSLSQTAAFSSTPHGTGGGIWGSGAAPASDGLDIFVATGNGTFDLLVSNPMDNDAGDSLLKLQPPTGPSTLLYISDYFTPYDVFSWDNNVGLCYNDEDFGSGGVLLPPNFTYTTNSGTCSGSGCNVAITADKQSNLYVTDQAYLGKANVGTSCAGSTNDIQCVTTPAIPGNDTAQGYWASPAYLWYTSGSQTYHMLYYSVDAPLTAGAMGGPGTPGVAPTPINLYQLQPIGSVGPPIPTTPTASTLTLFCQYSPTPSVSSSGTTAPLSGIVWAIEQNQNTDNQAGLKGTDCASGRPRGNPAALHAFCATAGAPNGPCPSALTEIYTSRGLSQTNQPGPANAFPTPTIYYDQVYMGTNKEIDVFGLCVNGVNGICKQ